MRSILRTPVVYAVLSVALPFTFIVLATVYSNWFSVLDNALSDLGHATESEVAPVFNTGLSLGGLLVAIGGVKYLWGISKTFSLIVVTTGYSLILVSVFDEVYGVLHFYVSVLFFLLLLISALYYVLRLAKHGRIRLFTIILVVASIVVWALHFVFRMPRGAALPELVSIGAVLPAYVHVYMQVTKLTTHN